MSVFRFFAVREAKTTIQHDKFFLSGAFKYAKRQGILNDENPVRDAA